MIFFKITKKERVIALFNPVVLGTILFSKFTDK